MADRLTRFGSDVMPRSVNRMGPIPTDVMPCAYPAECGCGNDADVITGADIALFGCCLADCPDAHGPDGRSWRNGYQARAMRWSGGFELHIDGVGVTQCVDLADAEATGRSYLAILDRDDVDTANITIWRPAS